jgi:hypothetical protein
LFDGADMSTARFSLDGTYRYELTRRWTSGSFVTWIMLNPSTADASTDDPTIRRCSGFARLWGFGAMAVVNLFALRATDPRELKASDDPVGPQNDDAIHDAVVKSRLTVAAWGAHGSLHDRAAEVVELVAELRPLYCLGQTRYGHPRHPLYLAASSRRELLAESSSLGLVG